MKVRLKSLEQYGLKQENLMSSASTKKTRDGVYPAWYVMHEGNRCVDLVELYRWPNIERLALTAPTIPDLKRYSFFGHVVHFRIFKAKA